MALFHSSNRRRLVAPFEQQTRPMPIDIGLLRPQTEGGKLEEFLQWQVLRYGNDYDNEELLPILETLNQERRRLLSQVTSARTDLHELQQYVRNSTNKEQIKKEIKRLKRQEIPDLEKSLENVSQEINEKLPRIANCVVSLDAQQPFASRKDESLSTAFSKFNETVLDPLYCLRGYETVAGCAILTGTGAALARSISNHALSVCRNHSTLSSFSPTIVPPSLRIDVSTAHSMMGCNNLSSNECPVCKSTETIEVPPWVAVSLLNEKKKYFDRQLPLGHVMMTTSASAADERERARLDSCQGKSWARQCQHGERIELFCLTGNTLSESNTVQLEMANAIAEFHQSLLVDKTECDCISLRAVEPRQLLPCEASRILVEDKTIGVILGYVSNMTDYCTRATNTRIASEYCHTVHGVLCSSIPETMEWMLQRNVVEHEDELGIGVNYPLSIQVQEQLGLFPPKEGVLFVPFFQRLHRGSKNGTLKRTELSNVSKPRVIATNEKRPGKNQPFVVRESPTAQQLRDERLSCPFDFLPIGG